MLAKLWGAVGSGRTWGVLPLSPFIARCVLCLSQVGQVEEATQAQDDGLPRRTLTSPFREAVRVPKRWGLEAKHTSALVSLGLSEQPEKLPLSLNRSSLP